MSDSVKFERDGLYAYKWDGDLRQDVVTKVTPDGCLKELRCACYIGDGVTLLDIFRTVKNLPPLKEFLCHYSWCWAMDEFMAQIEEPMREDEPAIEYMEVYWDFDADKFQGETTCSLSTGFHGIGFEGKGEHRHPSTNRVHWSCSCTPLYEIADCPVRLNEEVEVREPRDLDDKHPKPMEPTLFKAKCCFSLLEVLDAIFDDISFYGGPAEARELIEEINEIKDAYGDVEAIPLEVSGTGEGPPFVVSGPDAEAISKMLNAGGLSASVSPPPAVDEGEQTKETKDAQ